MVCDRPKEINRNAQGQLHNEKGMSISWKDGYGIYSLNGVTMKKEHVMTPSEKMTPKMVMSEKNADVKAELIRKFGIDRLSKYGKVVDSWKNYNDEWYSKSEYELIDMASIFNQVSYAPHLKMTNLTTGTYHLEGVDPNCKTIKDALMFRCGEDVQIVAIK